MSAAPVVASPESDRLFQEGRTLLKAGKIAEACDAFAASQKLAPRVGTLLNLGDCREVQGQTATAWALFHEAKELAAKLKDTREPVWNGRIAALAARLSHITLVVAPDAVPGLVIKRNGVTVERAQWNTPIALDPATYVFEATAPGHQRWSLTQPLGTKQKVDVAVAALVAEPAVDPPASPKDGARILATVQSSSRPPEEGSIGLSRRVPPPLVARPRRLPDPQVRYVGVGSMFGINSDDDISYGIRGSGSVPVPYGALRAVGSLLYYELTDFDGGYFGERYSLGFSVDYVLMPLRRLGFAAGAGVGQDRDYPEGGAQIQTQGWWSLRASPVILRLLEGRAEASLNVQYVRTDRGLLIYLLAIDLFPL